jgi:hypothetical protein
MIRLGFALALGIGLAAFSSGCASIQVATDFDRTADFSSKRTFTFVDGHVWVNGQIDDANTLVKQRIRAAIVAALTAKGLTETTTNPDLMVTYLAGARTRTEIEATPYPLGPGPYWVGGWWEPGYVDWWTRTYNEGTLIIDLIDARTKALLWRAYVKSEVNPPVSQEQINKAVAKAFEKYPPH